jgi:hypothetical protein
MSPFYIVMTGVCRREGRSIYNLDIAGSRASALNPMDPSTSTLPMWYWPYLPSLLQRSLVVLKSYYHDMMDEGKIFPDAQQGEGTHTPFTPFRIYNSVPSDALPGSSTIAIPPTVMTVSSTTRSPTAASLRISQTNVQWSAVSSLEAVMLYKRST